MPSCQTPTAFQWTRESIGNITYDASLKKISFQMDSFYPFTLLQDMHINIPFQSWELRPLGLNSAVLVVTAAATEVHFTVKASIQPFACSFVSGGTTQSL